MFIIMLKTFTFVCLHEHFLLLLFEDQWKMEEDQALGGGTFTADSQDFKEPQTW